MLYLIALTKVEENVCRITSIIITLCINVVTLCGCCHHFRLGCATIPGGVLLDVFDVEHNQGYAKFRTSVVKNSLELCEFS